MNCQFFIKPIISIVATPISACASSNGKSGKKIRETLMFFAKARYPRTANKDPLAPTLATSDYFLNLNASDPNEDIIPADR
jgi:hypothetical protein